MRPHDAGMDRVRLVLFHAFQTHAFAALLIQPVSRLLFCSYAAAQMMHFIIPSVCFNHGRPFRHCKFNSYSRLRFAAFFLPRFLPRFLRRWRWSIGLRWGGRLHPRLK